MKTLLKCGLGPLLALIAPFCSLAAESADAVPAYRQYGSWTSCRIGGGGGGSFYKVFVSPANPKRWYVYIDVGGIYRSDDAGATWHAIHGKGMRLGNYDVRDIDGDPRNADILLAVLAPSASDQGKSLYRTTDGGASWRRIAVIPCYGNGLFKRSGSLFARNPGNPDTVFLASQGAGVFKSVDNGLTWKSVPLDAYATNLVCDRADARRLWLCSQPATIAGKDFQEGFYASRDAGDSWKKLSDQSPISVAQDPKDPETLYGIFQFARIRISRNGGESWSDCSGGLPGDDRPKTSDLLSHEKYTAFAVVPDGVLVATASGDLYRLHSGETTWTPIPRAGVEVGDWFGGARHFGWCTTWIGVDAADPRHWLLTDWFGVYQSWDAGSHWKLGVEGAEPTVLHAVRQDPTDASIVHLGMADNGYFQSRDGGRTFDKISSDKPNNARCIDLSASDPRRLYMVGTAFEKSIHDSQQLYVSTDRGSTWTLSPLPAALQGEDRCTNSVATDPADAMKVYLAVSGDVGPDKGGVYRSLDGGKTWRWLGNGLPQGEKLFVESIWTGGGDELCVGSDGALLAVGHGTNRSFRYDRSQEKWLPMDLPVGKLVSLAPDASRPGLFYAGIAGDGVYQTTDHGETWQRIYQGNVCYLQTDRAKPGRLAVSTSETVIYSSDGGRTWVDLDREAAFPHPAPRSMAFCGDRLVAATGGSGCFWRSLPVP